MNRLPVKFKLHMLLLLDGLLHLLLLYFFVEDTDTIVLCILLEIAFLAGLHPGKKRTPATDIPTVDRSTHRALE